MVYGDDVSAETSVVRQVESTRGGGRLIAETVAAHGLARARLDSANQRLIATASLNQAAADNFEIALGRYKGCVASIVDVLIAHTAAASARQLRINAKLNWKAGRAQLALGRLANADPLRTDSVLPC